MIAGTEERRVELPDDILDGAGFGDGRENIAGLDAFDDFVFVNSVPSVNNVFFVNVLTFNSSICFILFSS